MQAKPHQPKIPPLALSKLQEQSSISAVPSTPPATATVNLVSHIDVQPAPLAPVVSDASAVPSLSHIQTHSPRIITADGVPSIRGRSPPGAHTEPSNSADAIRRAAAARRRGTSVTRVVSPQKNRVVPVLKTRQPSSVPSLSGKRSVSRTGADRSSTPDTARTPRTSTATVENTTPIDAIVTNPTPGTSIPTAVATTPSTVTAQIVSSSAMTPRARTSERITNAEIAERERKLTEREQKTEETIRQLAAKSAQVRTVYLCSHNMTHIQIAAKTRQIDSDKRRVEAERSQLEADGQAVADQIRKLEEQQQRIENDRHQLDNYRKQMLAYKQQIQKESEEEMQARQVALDDQKACVTDTVISFLLLLEKN